MTRLTSLLVVAGLAAAVSAQNNGDILFTSHGFQRSAGANPDFIGWIDVSGASFNTLYTVPNSDTTTRLSGIGRDGSGGFVFGNQPFPATANTGEVFVINNLFSGSGTRTNLAQGGNVNSPQEFAYHGPSNSMIVVNNPAGGVSPTQVTDGISALALGSNAVSQLFAEPTTGEPRYNGGIDIVADPARPGSFYVLTDNRGVDGGFSDEAPATLHRLTVSNDLSSVSVTLIQDFSASVVGANSIIRGSSIAVDPTTGDVLVSANNGPSERKIVRVGIDGAGNSTGVSLFADLFALQTGLGIGSGGVEEIEWDPFNNRWLLVEDLVLANSPSRITTLNADGISGYGILYSGGFAIRDIEVIPTPASVAVLGLGGLLAARRRR